MTRRVAERCKRLSIFELCGYFPKNGGRSSGSIKWTNSLGEVDGEADFIVVINPQDRNKDSYIALHYKYTDIFTGKEENLGYKIPLTTTSCYYGGSRFWFRCPLMRGEIWCGRWVGVLYGVSGLFGCRYCLDITYASQREGSKFMRYSVSIADLQRLEKEIKRPYYDRAPTRKLRRFMKMNEKLERNLMLLRGG